MPFTLTMSPDLTRARNVEAVVDQELLPAVVADVPGAEEFSPWTCNWVGQYGGITTLSVMTWREGNAYGRGFALPEDVLGGDVKVLMTMLDVLITEAVESIVNSHIEGRLCRNAACEECYR